MLQFVDFKLRMFFFNFTCFGWTKCIAYHFISEESHINSIQIVKYKTIIAVAIEVML